jgi:hypothetical protein
MGRWTEIAEWRGPTLNEGDGDGRPNESEDRSVEQRGVVLHIADGYYDGTIAWQRNDASDVSSQFVVAGARDVARGVPDGKAAQVVDTDIRAWTQRDGNGHWLSIECSGFSGDALSAAQIETCARILAKGHQVYGYPLQLATSPTGRGLGHHSMGTNGRSVPTDTWTGASWGHEQCPGPRIVAQKPLILARAIRIVNGVNTQPMEEDDMTPEQAQQLNRIDTLVNSINGRVFALGQLSPTVTWGNVAGEKNLLATTLLAIAAKVEIDPPELAAIKTAAAAGVAESVSLIVDALIARLPADAMTPAQVEQAVRDAFAGGLAPDPIA